MTGVEDFIGLADNVRQSFQGYSSVWVGWLHVDCKADEDCYGSSYRVFHIFVYFNLTCYIICYILMLNLDILILVALLYDEQFEVSDERDE